MKLLSKLKINGKTKWIILIGILLFLLFLVDTRRMPMRVFMNLNSKDTEFMLSSDELNFYDGFNTDSLELSGLSLNGLVKSYEVTYEGDQSTEVIKVSPPAKVSIGSNKKMKINNPHTKIGIKWINSPEAHFVIKKLAGKIEYTVKVSPLSSLLGQVGVGRSITVSGEEIVLSTEGVSPPNKYIKPVTIKLNLSLKSPNLALKGERNKMVITQNISDAQDRLLFKNIKGTQLKFHNSSGTGYNSSILGGDLTLWAVSLKGNFFEYLTGSLSPEDDSKTNNYVIFPDKDEYIIENLRAGKENLSLNIHTLKGTNLSRGTHWNLVQSIFPSYLEWFINEPTSKVSLTFITFLLTILAGLNKLKGYFFPTEKNAAKSDKAIKIRVYRIPRAYKYYRKKKKN